MPDVGNCILGLKTRTIKSKGRLIGHITCMGTVNRKEIEFNIEITSTCYVMLCNIIVPGSLVTSVNFDIKDLLNFTQNSHKI